MTLTDAEQKAVSAAVHAPGKDAPDDLIERMFNALVEMDPSLGSDEGACKTAIGFAFGHLSRQPELDALRVAVWNEAIEAAQNALSECRRDDEYGFYPPDDAFDAINALLHPTPTLDPKP